MISNGRRVLISVSNLQTWLNITLNIRFRFERDIHFLLRETLENLDNQKLSYLTGAMAARFIIRPFDE